MRLFGDIFICLVLVGITIEHIAKGNIDVGFIAIISAVTRVRLHLAENRLGLKP